MSNPATTHPASPRGASFFGGLSTSWAEFFFCLVVLLGGFLFLRDATHWASYAYVGNAQYGDAEFWWNGALHFSQGIIADNPNLTYRMGYATFGGLVVAVVGLDYRVFHQILLALFLILSCGLYFSLRAIAGRIAAGAAVLFVVFNPLTAEWLAVSTSDGLGLIFNLAAILALIAGVRGELRLRWIALFGLMFACGSLTRPLLLPFIVPAALAVAVAAWPRWRSVAIALGVMLGAFVLPTLVWMGIMAVTTGNFALTGESQDASSLYAASDPNIQTWQPQMTVDVWHAAQKRFHAEKPTFRQINDEYWRRTRENYRQHWKYHLARLWRHSFEIARITPVQATYASSFSNAARTWAKALLVVTLALGAAWRRDQMGAVGVGAVGAGWVIWPQSHPWLVIAISLLGASGLFFGRRVEFLWGCYWWAGVFALYLVGGTSGPPLAPVQALHALGYRLGFQVFFVGDLLVICTLGCLVARQFRPAEIAETTNRMTRPSQVASQLLRIGLTASLILLGLLLCTGAGIVTSRLIARNHQSPVAYPDFKTLSSLPFFADAVPKREYTPLMVSINLHTGERMVTSATTSGFIWNLPGQQRSILLLYHQTKVHPVSMSPYRFDVEISRQLSEREWMGRQGAWLIRLFADTAPLSNQPYYLEMPAVQAFVPLSADGKSYDTNHAVFFLLAKSATQLVASGELAFEGPQPEWGMNSGARRYPRRFALKFGHPVSDRADLTLNLGRARGKKLLRFGVELDTGDDVAPRAAEVHLQVTGSPSTGSVPLWQATLDPAAPGLVTAEIAPGDGITNLRLECEHLLPTDTLWFYELVLDADDFTQ